MGTKQYSLSVKKNSIRVWNKAGKGRTAAALVMYLSFASSREIKKNFRDSFMHPRNSKFGLIEWRRFVTENRAVLSMEPSRQALVLV
jgi:hypothetical protein